MNLLDLFSGIGGFSLGLHQAGFRTVAFCEQDSYCQAVLSERFPGVPIYDDIRTLTAERLRSDGIRVEALAGGFPCQDLSFAGKRAGIEGARSGLWGEYARLIRELRPRLVFVENVPGLLSAGMGRVLGDLAALGYDAEWDCIPASAVGAPHRRDRVWIIATDANSSRKPVGAVNAEASRMQEFVADPSVGRCGRESGGQVQQPWRAEAIGASEDVADADNEGLEGRDGGGVPERAGERIARASGAPVRDAALVLSQGRGNVAGKRGRAEPSNSDWRQPQRGLGRVAHGVSDWVDLSAWVEEPQDVPRVINGQENRAARLKALGNSIVPQIPAMLGRAFMKALQP